MNRHLRRLFRRALSPGVRRVGTAEASAYLREVAAARLSIGAAAPQTRMRAGANTAVIRWDTAERGTLYARIWPGDRKDRPVLQHVKAAEELGAAGLRTPEILFSDDTAATLRRWGLEAVVERAAAGRPMNDLEGYRADALAQLARELARMHGRRSELWGRPWIPGRGARDPREHWAARVTRFRERVPAASTSLSAEEYEASLGRLEKELRGAEPGRASLIHGDVSQGHVFVGEQPGLVWIDFGTVQYGAAEQDLAPVTRWLAPFALQKFLEAYEEARGEAVDWGRVRTFALLMHWERLNSRVQQRRRRAHRATPGGGRDQGPARKHPAKLEQDLRAAEAAIRDLMAAD